MKFSRLSTIFPCILLGTAVLPERGSAFLVTRRSIQSRSMETRSMSLKRFANNDDYGTNGHKNLAFAILSTDRDNKPNQGNFFYNDEVISHLYGYMYLVGFFVSQDALFLGTFFAASSLAAGATQQESLPCNPRIPGIVAGFTLIVTVVLKSLGFEDLLEGMIGSYEGPTESAMLYEVIICLLTMGWGFFGSWRTKEQVDGATYGF